MRHSNYLSTILGVCLILNSELAGALSSDSDQAIQIEADRVDIDEGQGVATYRGDVVVTQGSIRITAETVTITGTRNKAEKIVADGAPVTFRQTMDDDKGVVRAEALRAEYFADQDVLVLLNRARVWEGTREFQSDRIEYNRVKGTLKAGRLEGAPSGERVRATIPPRRPENSQAATVETSDRAQ
jgi:lipopolysaccharide export system protein LptA